MAESEIDDDGPYFRLLAKYARGCPAQDYEDICDDPAEYAAAGKCRDLATLSHKD